MYIPVTQATDKQIVDYMIYGRICPSLWDDFIDEGEGYDEESDTDVVVPPYTDYKLERTFEKSNDGCENRIRFDVTLFNANFFERVGREDWDNYIVECWKETFYLFKTDYIKIYDNEKSEDKLF